MLEASSSLVTWRSLSGWSSSGRLQQAYHIEPSYPDVLEFFRGVESAMIAFAAGYGNVIISLHGIDSVYNKTCSNAST